MLAKGMLAAFSSLVNAHHHHIPSKHNVNDMDAIRRLGVEQLFIDDINVIPTSELLKNLSRILKS